MRTVSSLHEIGFNEESMSRSPTDWFAGVRALRRGSVSADARIAPEGMSLPLSYHGTAQNVLGLFIWTTHGFFGPCKLGPGGRQIADNLGPAKAPAQCKGACRPPTS